jgi:chromosomal replication initiation ATPase DnaA
MATFNNYAEKVSEAFDVPKERIFTKTKVKRVSDARQSLYYLCHSKPMTMAYIRDHMKQNGYDVAHSSVQYGISQTKKRMQEDESFKEFINFLR